MCISMPEDLKRCRLAQELRTTFKNMASIRDIVCRQCQREHEEPVPRSPQSACNADDCHVQQQRWAPRLMQACAIW